MSAVHVLAAQARRLNRESGAPPIPALYFFTDPRRTPDPVAAAARLPRETAVVFRHFGAPGRARTARRLARVCRARGLFLFIGADPGLAARVSADGVHWPERLTPARALGVQWMTVAAHSAEAVARAARAGADACVLSAIFKTHSPDSGRPLGAFRASQIARRAGLPTIALGGINPRTAAQLVGRGFAGLAAVEALSV